MEAWPVLHWLEGQMHKGWLHIGWVGAEAACWGQLWSPTYLSNLLPSSNKLQVKNSYHVTDFILKLML